MTFETNDYTVVVYKTDKRIKSGERVVYRQDHTKINKQHLEHLYRTTWFAKDGYRFEIHETYREVKNIMTGSTVRERYDTPYSCSVASETYWSS
jgi:hypothetical protein